MYVLCEKLAQIENWCEIHIINAVFFLYHLIGFEMKYLILEKNLVKYLYP